MSSQPTPLRAVNSASKMPMRKHCPGSALAERGLPRVDNPASTEGTLLHLHDADPTLPRDTLSAQQRQTLDRNKLLRERFLETELPRLGIPENANVTILKEQEFFLCDSDGERIISHGQPVPAHPDLIYWYPDFLIAIIFDSKFGRIDVVPAWLNEQLKTYFVVFADCYDAVQTVIVAITQPWAKKPNDFHSAEYSAQDLEAHRNSLINIVRATENPNAIRKASVESCVHGYCAAIDRCPVALKSTSETAVIQINELDAEQLEDLGPDIELAERVIEHWYKRMNYLAEKHPETLSRYTLKPTGYVRTVQKIGSAFRILFEKGMLVGKDAEASIEAFFGFCKFSLSDLEDHIALNKDVSADRAKEISKEILGDLIAEKAKSKSLVKKTESIHTAKLI